jgi:hypothetical protein
MSPPSHWNFFCTFVAENTPPFAIGVLAGTVSDVLGEVNMRLSESQPLDQHLMYHPQSGTGGKLKKFLNVFIIPSPGKTDPGEIYAKR